ncbi:MAG: hypothetical protein GYB67_02040 [Chloroflexi bacterium]|nr:hypothetical protein [Chloroflexota bacterium]
MNATSLSQFFILYTWFFLAALLFFLILIARFYARLSGETTYYGLFIVPIVLFGLAAVRYNSINLSGGDLLGDLLTASAGIILIILSVRLYHQMTVGRGEHA